MSATCADDWDAYRDHRVDLISGQPSPDLAPDVVARLLDDGLAMHVTIERIRDDLRMPI